MTASSQFGAPASPIANRTPVSPEHSASAVSAFGVIARSGKPWGARSRKRRGGFIA